MPEINISCPGLDSITLKCDKVIERISRKPISSDLPNAETLAIDLRIIASVIALTGFFTTYADKNALRDFTKDADGTSGNVQIIFPHENNKEISTMILSLTTDYIEGEGHWKFTLELKEIF